MQNETTDKASPTWPDAWSAIKARWQTASANLAAVERLTSGVTAPAGSRLTTDASEGGDQIEKDVEP